MPLNSPIENNVINPDTEVDPGYAGGSPANYRFAMNPYSYCFVRVANRVCALLTRN